MSDFVTTDLHLREVTTKDDAPPPYEAQQLDYSLPHMTTVGELSRYPQSLIDAFHRSFWVDHDHKDSARLMWRDEPHVPQKARGKRAGGVQQMVSRNRMKFRGESPRHYRKVVLNGVKYYEHVIIFCLMRGYCPAVIDHDDGNSLNNHISNLTDAGKGRGVGSAQSYNAFNRKHKPRDLPSGVYRKVLKDGAVKFEAKVRDPTLGKKRSTYKNSLGKTCDTTAYKQRHLGYFDCPQEAGRVVARFVSTIRDLGHVKKNYQED